MNVFIIVQDTLVLSLYTLTSILALIGNGLLYKVSSQRRNSFSQTTASLTLSTTRLFLLNLAIADILSGLAILIQFLFCSKYFLEKFTFSSYLCLISKSIQILGHNASTLTVCLISLDRYRRVQNPLEHHHRMQSRRALLFIWILPSIFSTSCLVSMKVSTYFNSYKQLISCQILFPLTLKYLSNDYIQDIRLFCFALLFYIIPLVTNTILCILTIRIIARRSIIGVQRFQMFEQTRTRSIRILIAIVFAFAFSHLPVHYIHVRDFIISSMKLPSAHLIRTTNCHQSTIYLWFYWLGISCSCHNPIIYSWYNRKYRTLSSNFCRSIVFCGRSES